MNNNEYIINLENQIIEAFQLEVLKGNIDLTSKHGHFENHSYTFVNKYVDSFLTDAKLGHNRGEQIKAIVELELYNWHHMNHPTSTCQVAHEGILDALMKSGRVHNRANYKITLADIT